jgi:hypothetical protein
MASVEILSEIGSGIESAIGSRDCLSSGIPVLSWAGTARDICRERSYRGFHEKAKDCQEANVVVSPRPFWLLLHEGAAVFANPSFQKE